MWESADLQKFLQQILATPQFFRLTIDLKKLKFAPPICTRVVEDRSFVESISLSYLTSPVFKSNDVFHAVSAKTNAKDPTELLVTDGFCSFRFEDRLLWKEFIALFVNKSHKDPGAVLPIYVRARQADDKCSTLGIATLTFASFLTPDRDPSLAELPQLFFSTCASGGGAAADLPVFEVVLKLPIISKETNAMVAVLTVGIAVDMMNVHIDPALARTSVPGRGRISQIASAPSAGRLDDEFTMMERCFTDVNGRRRTKRLSPDSAPQIPSSSTSPSPVSAAENSTAVANPASKDHLIQCEMMLLKLNAEQSHQKFREEVRLIEAKSEERIEAIRKENLKLRSENRQLEKKLVEFEQKLQYLQESIVQPPVCTHVCSTTSSGEAALLKRENERLQVLLKAERQRGLVAGDSTSGGDSSNLPHAHSVHPVYHHQSARESRLGNIVARVPPGAGAGGTSSSSSNTDSSPLSSRSRQLLAFHLKRSA